MSDSEALRLSTVKDLGLGEDFDTKQEGAREASGYNKEGDPPFKIFKGSKVAVSKSVGPSWKKKFFAAVKAYEHVWEVWDQLYAYYNNDQNSDEHRTSRGVFRRGDNTENVLFANVNTILPAIYSKNPEVTGQGPDRDDAPFVETLVALINTLLKRKAAPGLDMKPKMKRAALFAELTNAGVLKLDYQLKEESREAVARQLEECSRALEKANPEEVTEIYGKLQALEEAMEVSTPSGPRLKTKQPHHVIVDPLAEQADGMDAWWMSEIDWLPTEFLNARFTEKKGDKRVSVYKPTHTMEFQSQSNNDEDENFIGALNRLPDNVQTLTDQPSANTTDERLAYLSQHLTQVVWIWDRTTRRVFLFDATGDWTWPIWVWDDPLNLTRFFPYFLLPFVSSIGGTTTVGEAAYYLDQQDEINEINRELARIRKSVFRYLFYDSNALEREEAEKLVKAIDGSETLEHRAVGIDVQEGKKLSDSFHALVPPSAEYAALFDKQPLYEVIDKLSANNDALRGTQFKANTTEDAVQAYMSASRIRVGARTDAIEDCAGDICSALAELCVQFMDKEDVAKLIGREKAEAWKQMNVAEFSAFFSIELVAGSTEKPTSQFKKQEAIQIVQAVGQFAAGAPATTMKIMLKVLSKAFTEMNINKEDWDEIDKELQMNMQRGVNTDTSTPNTGGGGGAGAPPAIPRPPTLEEAQNAP